MRASVCGKEATNNRILYEGKGRKGMERDSPRLVSGRSQVVGPSTCWAPMLRSKDGDVHTLRHTSHRTDKVGLHEVVTSGLQL